MEGGERQNVQAIAARWLQRIWLRFFCSNGTAVLFV